MGDVWAVAAFTLREVWRRRVLLVAVLLTAAFLALYGTALHSQEDNVRRWAGNHRGESGAGAYYSLYAAALVLLGLYFANFITAFLAIFSAVGTISGEIDSGLLLAVASRPIPRRHIILGKLTGYGVLILVYAAALFLAIFFLARSQLGLPLSFSLPALALFCLGPLIPLAVTLLGSTFLPTLATGAAAVMLYGFSLMGGMIEQFGAVGDHPTLVRLGIVSSLVMPADAIYRAMAHAFVSPILSQAGDPGLSMMALGPFGVYSTPSVWMIVYAAAFAVAALAVAVRSFARRDL